MGALSFLDSVSVTPKTCTAVLTADAPTAASGWRAQFKRDNNINVGSLDNRVPFYVTATVPAGTSEYYVEFKKTGESTVLVDLGSATCDGSGGGGSGGDVSSNTSSSIDGEVVLFSGTSGKTVKRATGTGFGLFTSGVLSYVSGTDVGGVLRVTGSGTYGFGPVNLADTDAVTGVLPAANLGTGSGITTKFLRGDNTWQTIPGGGDALTSGHLGQFASTTSAQLKGLLSDELGDASGKAIFALGTLAITSGKTLTSTNTLTLSGTDGSTVSLGAGGTVLYSGGPAGTPASITLTNATGLPTAGLLNNSVTLAKMATQAAGTVLANLTGGAAVPSAVTIDALLDAGNVAPALSIASGDLIFGSGTDELDVLAIGSEGNCLKVASSLPAWGSCSSPEAVDALLKRIEALEARVAALEEVIRDFAALFRRGSR